jgi:putative transposase
MLNTSDLPGLKGHSFPRSVIAFAVWSYLRFNLSLRDVEELLAERGVVVSYETIRRRGCARYLPSPAWPSGEARPRIH